MSLPIPLPYRDPARLIPREVCPHATTRPCATGL